MEGIFFSSTNLRVGVMSMQMLIFYKECWSSIHHKKGTYQLPLWHSTQKHNQSGIDTENGVFTRQAYKITQHGRHENVINQLSNQVMTLLVIVTDGINPFLLLFFPFFYLFFNFITFLCNNIYAIQCWPSD